MVEVAHRSIRAVERDETKLTWARIFNPRIDQFSKTLPKKRKCKELKKG